MNTKTDIRFRDDIFHLGYQVVSVGHEHENDACIVSENKSDGKVIDSLWLCYNSVTGESGETISTDYARKLRIFQIDFEDRQMLSWKREQKTGEAFDYQMVHDYGKKI